MYKYYKFEQVFKKLNLSINYIKRKMKSYSHNNYKVKFINKALNIETFIQSH